MRRRAWPGGSGDPQFLCNPDIAARTFRRAAVHKMARASLGFLEDGGVRVETS
jgi:hypothetical protein